MNIKETVLVGDWTQILEVHQLELFKMDEVVSHDAAVHGEIWSGVECINEIILFPVHPCSIGIEMTDAVVTKIFVPNSVNPSKKA